MMFALPFPAIDPVLVHLGPLAIRWYSLAYIVGLVAGWRYVRRLASWEPKAMAPAQADDFLVWATLGVILGGRFGYVLFYNPGFYLANPGKALALWEGGMSFHGGLVGVIVALAAFARRHGLSFLAISDRVACATPIGLFLGRLANFINSELFGRVTDLPWAMVFPRGGPLPRHPSQIYEAALEGVVLFLLLLWLCRIERLRARTGTLSGAFLAAYGLLRFLVEFVREPDPQLGFLFAGATMGQVLSLPMLAVGLALIWLARGARRA
ncbi:MAG: prolipoprotein diacylglyceryl transferase [Proteobacteria bacterium]|nr:prolipoprotein diacylglyceryl transferase [Pseudomonadota bacterium]